MKILITGATGFVGSHLTDLLHKQGHEIYGLVRSEKKALEFNIKGQLVLGSLAPTGKLEWLDSLPNDIDIVIHTAGVVHSSIASKFQEFNTQTTNNLIDQIFSKYPDVHFTFISSLAAMGPQTDAIITEQNTPNPVSEYGRSKLLSEQYLKSFESKSFSIIRPPMVIGPRDPAVLDIFKMVKSGIIIGPGVNFKTKEYSFVNVLDLIEGIALISLNKIAGDFFLTNSKTILFKDLIEEIKQAMNKKITIFIPIPHSILKVIGTILKLVPLDSRLTSDKVNELIQSKWTCSGSKYQALNTKMSERSIRETVTSTLADYKERNWL